MVKKEIKRGIREGRREERREKKEAKGDEEVGRSNCSSTVDMWGKGVGQKKHATK